MGRFEGGARLSHEARRVLSTPRFALCGCQASGETTTAKRNAADRDQSSSKKARRKGKGRPTRKELRPDATQSKPLEETKHTDDGFHFIQDEDGLFHGLLSSKQRKPI